MRKCPACANRQTASDNNDAIVIVGNMNVGKSTLFSKICEKGSTSINFPGTTVSIRSGRIKNTSKAAFDTPGILSIFSTNEDETVARDILLPRDTFNNKISGVIVVADAKNLKRSIAITLQYAEYGLPMLMDLNMIDEARSRGIKINKAKLAEILNIEICSSIARENIGVRRIISRLAGMKTPGSLVIYPEWIENFIDIVKKKLPSTAMPARIIGLLLLAEDKGATEYIEKNCAPGVMPQLRDIISRHRQEDTESFRASVGNLYNVRAEQIAREVQQVKRPSTNQFMTTLGDWCMQLPTGIPIAVIVMMMMYFFVGSFGATFLVDTINGTIFEGFLIPLTTKLVAPIPSPFLRDMLVDPDFGILPTGVFLALGLVLPVLFCFYLAFGLLEDSGYLPRLSVLMNKAFQKMGLNGKGVIPLVMGFSCVTMAILTTRMLDSKKEKNIATFLLLLGMPCAPLIAVMLVILEEMPASATITVFGLIFLQMFVVGIIANKIIPGDRTPFLMEIPPLRRPRIFQTVKMATIKTYFFMKEAVPIFIIASFIVFLFNWMGGLEMLEHIARPLVKGLMGLPEKSVQVFIKTMIRRESGATELEHLKGLYDNVQLVVNLLVMTFLTPCMNATVVLIKERGLKTASVIIGTVLLYAVIAGTLLNQACRLLGVTFT